jgi:hypothetical protein
MNEIYILLASSVFWFLFYQLYLIKKVAVEARKEWVRWAVSDDGQHTLLEVLGQESGVIDHIAFACGQLMKDTLSGGFGAVAKKLNNDPQVAMQSGLASQLKEMKWYESALLMKIANQVPALQPLLGLSQGVKQLQESPDKPPISLEEAQNL